MVRIPQNLINRYNENLSIFNQYFPNILKKSSNSKVSIRIKEGEVKDILINGQSMYNMNAKTMCTLQVKKFLGNKYCNKMSPKYLLKFTYEKEFPITGEAISYFAKKSPAYKALADLISKSDKVIEICKDTRSAHIFVVLGIGLGYHIEELVDKMNINHLILVEHDVALVKSSFYAVSWRNIIHKFSKKGKSINFVLLEDTSQFIMDSILRKNLNPVLNLDLRVLQHYKLDLFDKLRKKLVLKSSLSLKGLGNLDDEFISLRNTYSNCKNNVKIFKKPEEIPKFNVPIFIIGSGPSLDDTIWLLRQLKDKALIVSCGTALRVLLKENIIPDYHVEIERLEDQYHILRQIPENYRKKIHLLALNVVDPRVFKLFKSKTMFMKNGDAGTKALDMTLEAFKATGPTVTNGAFAFFSQALNEEIFLFGVDFGYWDVNYHHAKGTIYSDVENFKDLQFKKEFEVKGNLGDKVYTDGGFLYAKISMENVIESMPKFADLKVYNVGRGAFISGAIPLRVSEVADLIKGSQLGKKEEIKQYINANRMDSKALLQNFKDNVNLQVKGIAKVRNVLTAFEKKVSSVNSIIDFFEFIQIEYEELEQVLAESKLQSMRGTFLHIDGRSVLHCYFSLGNPLDCLKNILNASIEAKKLVLERAERLLENLL